MFHQAQCKGSVMCCQPDPVRAAALTTMALAGYDSLTKEPELFDVCVR